MAQSAMTFIYDNIPSENYGLYIGNLGGSGDDSGESSTSLEVVFDNISSRSENLIYGIRKKEPMLKFNMKLFSYNTLTKEDVAYIDQWLLNNSSFKKLMFCQDDMAKFAYNAIVESTNILYNGNLIYGIECNVLCDSSYAYQSTKTNSYNIKGVTKIRFNNLDNAYGYLYPKVRFVCNKENGTIRVKNVNDKNREFVITGLKYNEEINIDEWQQLRSSTGLLRLDKCNKNFLRFCDGVNQLEVSGDLTELQITYQFRRAIGG